MPLYFKFGLVTVELRQGKVMIWVVFDRHKAFLYKCMKWCLARLDVEIYFLAKMSMNCSK